MTLIENEEGHKTSIRIPGVQKFSWIENTRFLCCVSHSNPRNKDAPSIPTKVVLIDVKQLKKIKFII